MLRRPLLATAAIAGALLPAAPAAADSLRWAPPPLTNPTTIELGQGFTITSLDRTRDYIVKLPPYKKLGGTVIRGGRNVVIVGGHISVPPDQPDDTHRRALYIKENAGTVHVEGVLIDASAGGVSDGIAIASPESTVQIQNVRVAGLTGTQSGFHADVLQPWGGVGALRVDRLTGSSNYQGLFLPRDLGDIGSVSLSRVNLFPAPGPYEGGGHMLWITPGLWSCQSYPLELSEVYVRPRSGASLPWSVWPQRDAGFGCPNSATAEGGVTWPGLQVRGQVKPSTTATTDFVPEGAAGVGYASPGYGDGTPVPEPGSGTTTPDPGTSTPGTPVTDPDTTDPKTRPAKGGKGRVKRAIARRCRTKAVRKSKRAKARRACERRLLATHGRKRASRRR